MGKILYISKIAAVLVAAMMAFSCIKEIKYVPRDSPDNPDGGEQKPYTGYIYPFEDQPKTVTAEITLELDRTVDPAEINASIPPLKYNKTLLFMLSQDDCKQEAFCCTWAAIHGRALSNSYYYNSAQLSAGDLPPDAYTLGKTLGSTDGAGNEVRFSFATSLTPEDARMGDVSVIDKGFTGNYWRFYMRSLLFWENVYRMCNYGVGLSFHDLDAEEPEDPLCIDEHYRIAQQIITGKLKGRGCKFLAEPDGNKTYLAATLLYDTIKTITAQESGAGFEVEPIYPFQTGSIEGKVVLRQFFDNPEDIKTIIAQEMALPPQDRKAVAIGVHGTDAKWVSFLLWLNNNHGKDGDDQVWAVSQEEYYEYNHYRTHVTIEKTIVGNTLKIKATMPAGAYFCYPALTINVEGIDAEWIRTTTTSADITGLSIAANEGGIALNIDCRQALPGLATHLVEQYEKDKSNKANQKDAHWIVGIMKESEIKQSLKARLK